MEIEMLRNLYPGLSDADAAKAFAQKHSYVAVIRYKSSDSAPDFTDVVLCNTQDQIHYFLANERLYEAEVIYYDVWLARLRTKLLEAFDHVVSLNQ